MAQVVACADHHIVPSKFSTDEAIRTHHAYLQGDKRSEELARMLSGKISASSLQRAQEMLQVAASDDAL